MKIPVNMRKAFFSPIFLSPAHVRPVHFFAELCLQQQAPSFLHRVSFWGQTNKELNSCSNRNAGTTNRNAGSGWWGRQWQCYSQTQLLLLLLLLSQWHQIRILNHLNGQWFNSCYFLVGINQLWKEFLLCLSLAEHSRVFCWLLWSKYYLF